MIRRPFFSIVIPAFNRETEIRRAIDSCLCQSFDDFDIIVVDDHSTDRTPEAVASMPDPRVRLLCQERNRGVCPARNEGVRASSAEWIVFLDSDHELLPGALARLHEAAASTAPGIGRIGFMYGFDDGRTSPDPLPQPGPLDYVAWLRWIDIVRWSDALWVTRRSCFKWCMMPETFAAEFSYHVTFAKSFISQILPEKLALQYTDSSNRLTVLGNAPAGAAARQRWVDAADDWQQVLAEHGGALLRWAPGRHERVLRAIAVSQFMAGRKWQGLSAGLRSLRAYPRSRINWVVPALALLGPRVTRWAKTLRAHRIERAAASGNSPGWLAHPVRNSGNI